MLFVTPVLFSAIRSALHSLLTKYTHQSQTLQTFCSFWVPCVKLPVASVIVAGPVFDPSRPTSSLADPTSPAICPCLLKMCTFLCPHCSATQVAAVIDADQVCSALPQASRQRIFEDVVREAVLQRALAEAAEKADNEFRALLTSASPAIRATSTWPGVKPQLARSKAYQALTEKRR